MNAVAEVGLQKARKDKLIAENAVRILPPEMRSSGGSPTQFVLWYGDADNQQKQAPCTKHVWRRAEGRSGAGVVRDGLDSKLRSNFIIYREKADGPVVAIDRIPKDLYTAKKDTPEHLQSAEGGGEFTINPNTGEITVDELPLGFTLRKLHLLIREINKVDLIKVGDVLGGSFEVVEQRGNKIYIAPPQSSGAAASHISTYGQ